MPFLAKATPTARNVSLSAPSRSKITSLPLLRQIAGILRRNALFNV
jgi:hypothetical protein